MVGIYSVTGTDQEIADEDLRIPWNEVP